jgi:GNAT superfamily N-acetyltransferase
LGGWSVIEPVSLLGEPVSSLGEPVSSLGEPVSLLGEPVSSLIEPVEIRRVDWFDPRAAALRGAMDAEMDTLYATVVTQMSPELSEKIGAALVVDPEEMVSTFVAADGEQFVGHAALRPFENALEVKRVFVAPEYRGRGISKALMAEAEEIARERGVRDLVLQTGDLQAEAIALYEGIGYRRIPPFGRYAGLDLLLYFGKPVA